VAGMIWWVTVPVTGEEDKLEGVGTGGGRERRRVGTEETFEVVLGTGGSATMAATALSSSPEGTSGPLAPAVGSRATRSTELGHGGARGGRRQQWR
jgi:hypothetical protein